MSSVAAELCQQTQKAKKQTDGLFIESLLKLQTCIIKSKLFLTWAKTVKSKPSVNELSVFNVSWIIQKLKS